MQTPIWTEDTSSPERRDGKSRRPGVKRIYHFSHTAAQNLGCEVLERSAVKVARSVLRRGRGSNPASLFDSSLTSRAVRHISPEDPGFCVVFQVLRRDNPYSPVEDVLVQ